MNNRRRSEIDAKNDLLAQGSEARAKFCSAKRLEDVKTTGKMENIDAGWCLEPVSNPALILRQQAIEASLLLLENEKPPAGHCRWFWRFIVK
jgi:hypothetical protein